MQANGSSRVDGQYRKLTKFILVDEADNFLSQDFESLRKILKEGREFGVGTILSTQFLDHFCTGEDDYAKYFLTWVVHNVGELKPSAIGSVFKVKDNKTREHYADVIASLKMYNSLVKIGNNPVVHVKELPFWKYDKDRKAEKSSHTDEE